MADEDPPAAAEAEAAARMRVPMPQFDGVDATSHVAREFLGSFDDWCDLANYDEAQKARALRYALKGVAKRWWTSEERGQAVDVANWGQVTAAFRARFLTPPNPRYIDEELGKLTQQPKESVRAYLDRVKIAVSLLQDLWPIPAADAPAARAAKQIANQLVYEKLVLQFFLRSLRPAIKSGIAQAPGLVTLQDFVQAAVRSEELLSEVKPASAPIASVSSDVASIGTPTSGSKQKTKNKKKETVASSASGSSSSNPNARSNKPSPSTVPPEGYVCRICNIPGHWIQFCPHKGAKPAKAQSRQLQAVTYQPVVPQPGSYFPMASPVNVYQAQPRLQGSPSTVPQSYVLNPAPPAPPVAYQAHPSADPPEMASLDNPQPFR